MANNIKEYKARLAALDQERQTWVPHWKELSEGFLPRRGRALYGEKEANKGTKRNQKLINSVPAFAVRTLASGMMAGLTNPSLPWMQLRTPDTDLMKYQPVRLWLADTQQRILNVFAKSNFYNSLFVAYADLAVFGTFTATLLEDPQIIRVYNYAPGRYWLAASARGEVDTLFREVPMTVKAMVDTFGLSRVSLAVKTQYDRGEYDKTHQVVQTITPNTSRDVRKYDNRNMPYSSCYYEANAAGNTPLREGGFEEWPGLTPRWDVPDEDIYGSSPAMLALGDSRSLQLQEKRKAQAVDKLVDPPMVATPDLRNQRASLLPGDVTYVGFSNTGGAPGFQPAYTIKPDMSGLLDDIKSSTDRIKRALYEDLFLMFTLTDRREITAREVEERHGEKLLMLGPVLQRLEKELLDPGINRTFNIMLRNGMIAPPPPEVQGMDLGVEYISILAQAQRSVSAQSIERVSAFVGTVAPIQPSILDKMNYDEALSEYCHALGASPRLLVPDESVEAIRAQRAQQEQMAQMAAAAQPMKDMSSAAQTLSETPMNGGTALEQLAGA